MSNQRFYEEGDAEEILRMASRESVTGGMSRDRLLETAAELGISPEAVQRAEEQLQKKREADRITDEENALRKEFRQSRRRSFWNDFVSYIGTNAALVGVWWFTGHGHFWPGWVLGFWGIHLVTEFFETFLNGNDEAKFRRWLRRRNRKMGMKEMMVRAEPVLDDYFARKPGEKLGAIKELGERLNIDLRDAKDIVETYEAEEQKSGPVIGVRIGRETPKRVD